MNYPPLLTFNYGWDILKELRFARRCYRHLAGAVAVEINRALLDRKLLVADSETSYILTTPGQEWCHQLGMLLPKSGRGQGRMCLDWTERRHHLGGTLGAALYSRLIELRWVIPNARSRAVHFTQAGAIALERRLGITIPR